MKKTLGVVLSFSILISVGSTLSAKPQPQSDPPQRGLQLDDGFLAEDIQEPRFSPDGEALAVVRLRPVKDVRGYVLPIEGLRGDIWVQTAPGQPLKAITDGRADQAGHWKLQWSSDSRQLAFLRAHGKAVTPWVWDREKNIVRQLSARSVDHYDGEPCRWADARRLICLVAKEGETIPPTGGFAEEHYGEVMRKVWGKQAGGEVTASVLDSRFYDSPRGELLVIDTASGESRFLSEAFLSRYPVVPYGGSPSTWWLAPGGRSVALLDPGAPILNAADGKRILSDVIERRSFAIELRSIDDGELELSQPLPQGIFSFTFSVQWSPDGQNLAFYTYDHAYRLHDEASLAPRLWLVSIPRRQAVALDAGELRLASLVHQPWWDDDQDVPWMAPLFWTAGRTPQLLVRAGQKSAPPGSREEWWAVSDRHPPRAVSKSMSAVPQQWAVRTDTALIGLVDGDVWQLQPQTARARNLTAAFEPAITYVYPSTDGRFPSHILFGHGPHGYAERVTAGDWGKPVEQTVTYRLNLRTGAIERLKMPATDAGWADTELADYALSKTSVAYLQSNWNGTSLWRLDGSEAHLQPLLTVNQFFRKIARPQTRWFEYVSSEGVKRRGWVMLPHGYVPGRRYPTVVTVRMGSLGFDREGSLLPQPAGAFLGSLSAMGYLIFSPDFDEGYQYRTAEIDRAMVRAGNDIHAALEALVAQGYADPDRFVIEGGSGTGKSALNLIAATHRFKAASAYVMGLLPEFTKLPLFTRYTDYAHVYVSREGRNYPGMRYSREEVRAGSLLSHIDLVQTPVLLAHGDLDPIPLDNSEEYFNALVFRGKRAQFVRYWGETHCLGCTNPANMADFVQRELAWFDEFADIARDADGHMLWDGDRAKSRGGAAPLTPGDYGKFDFFASGGDSDDALVYPAPGRSTSAVVGQRE